MKEESQPNCRDSLLTGQCRNVQHTRLFSQPRCVLSKLQYRSIVNVRSTCSSLRSLCGVRQWTLFPIVHAADGTKTEELAQQAQGEFKKPLNFVSDEMIQEYLAQETGWQRVKDLWSKDYKGDYSPHAEMAFGMTLQASVVGFVIASYYAGREAKENFEHKHQSTKFQSRFRALRALNDFSTMAGIRTGAKWGAKIGGFVGTIICTSQSIAAYRNKSSFIEYTVGGALAGALFKFTMGPRGMLVASLLGGTLGTVGGLIIFATKKLTNNTQEQMHYYEVQNKLQIDMYNKGTAITAIKPKGIS